MLGEPAREVLCTLQPLPSPFYYFSFLVVLHARNSDASKFAEGSAALPAPKNLPGAVCERFQELLVIVFLPLSFFLMGIKSQEVKEHVVLQAAGEIFPPTWNKHRVFPSRTGRSQNSIAPHERWH